DDNWRKWYQQFWLDLLAVCRETDNDALHTLYRKKRELAAAGREGLIATY
ncbi:TPA: hypothetical protein IGZ65_005151, partial [Escherichia coli]|nr:hypothetical protein [Escherichia coli]